MKMNVAFAAIFSFLHLHLSWGSCPPKAPFNAEEDAQAIAKENTSADVLIRILPCRSFADRKEISTQVKKVTGKLLDRKPMEYDYIFYQDPDKIKDTDPFLDCVDVMVDSAQNTFNRFLEGACYTEYKPETAARMVAQILIAADDHKQALTDDYDRYSDGRSDLKLKREIQSNFPKCDYQNMLLSMHSKIREPDPPTEVDLKLVEEQVDLVLKEKNDEGWNDHRTILEDNLMIKPIKFAQPFLKKYQEKNNGIPIEQDIEKELGHNKELEFGYKSLVQAIQNMNKFIATRIHDSINEADKFATPTVFVVGYSENPNFKDIKAAFKEAYGVPMQKFILDAKPDAPLNRMLAELIGEDPPPPEP